MAGRKAMHNGQLYTCNDKELFGEQTRLMNLIYDYNHCRPTNMDKRNELIKKIFAEVGENCYIEPPFHANWGCHTHLGKNFYANFNLTLVDDTDIYIGDYVMIAPNVTLATASHPIAPDLRARDCPLGFNLPIKIGNNVWIGTGAIILPGVTIGDNSVIGAGSVVTKDIPSNVVAVGNPCRVLREISDYDHEYYHKGMKIDYENGESNK